MFSLNSTDRYYLCLGSVDMRKGFDSLCGVVRSCMGKDPLSGEVFIFINRTGTTMKLLHWERGGLVVYHKRLESGKFTMPLYDENRKCYHLEWSDLVMMVEGIQYESTKRQKRFAGIVKQ